MFNKKYTMTSIAKLALLATSLFLVACSSDTENTNNGDDDKKIEFSIQQNPLVNSNFVSILTSPDVESITAVYGKVIEQVMRSDSQNPDGHDKHWVYILDSKFIENRSLPLDFQETLTFTTQSGEVETVTQKMFLTDQYLPYQWHIYNDGVSRLSEYAPLVKGIDLNVLPAWHTFLYDSDGSLSSIYLSGSGVKVLVYDTPIDFHINDLKNNKLDVSSFVVENQKQAEYLSFMNIDSVSDHAYDDLVYTHGTQVAGILSASSGDGGITGIAPNAKLLSLDFNKINELNENHDDDDYLEFDQVYKLLKFNNSLPDVLSMSLGLADGHMNMDPLFLIADDIIDNNIPAFKSAGNEASSSQPIDMFHDKYKSICINSPISCSIGNQDEIERNSNAIVVGALNHLGYKSNYSTASSDLWVSAFGGNDTDQDNYIGIISTFSSLGCTVLNDIANGENFVSVLHSMTDCMYTSEMNGTSAATPEVSGIVALMKEVDKSLSIPQIKYILAKSSRNDQTMPSLSLENQYVKVDNLHEGTILADNGWTDLANNLRFSNQYGFGLVDAKAAVDYASSCYEDPDCARRQVDFDNDIDNSREFELLSDSDTYESSINCEQSKDDNDLFVLTCTIDSSGFVGDDDNQLTNKVEQIDSVNVNIDAIKFSFNKTNSDGSKVIGYCKEVPNLDNLSVETSRVIDYKYSNYQVTLSNGSNTAIIKPYSSVYMPFGDYAHYTKDETSPNEYEFALVNNFYLSPINAETKWKFEIRSSCEVDFDYFINNFGMRLTTYETE